MVKIMNASLIKQKQAKRAFRVTLASKKVLRGD
jgi:hypothetical protein